MRKAIALFLVGFVPYGVALEWIGVYSGAFEKPLTDRGFLLLLLIPAALWLAGLAGVGIFLRDAERAGLARSNLIVKLVQIPAYLAIFGMALPFLTIPFTWVFVVFLAIQAWMAVCLTGRIGAAAVGWCGEQGILSRKQAARHRLLQSVLCADIFSAVWVYIKSRKEKERLS